MRRCLAALFLPLRASAFCLLSPSSCDVSRTARRASYHQAHPATEQKDSTTDGNATTSRLLIHWKGEDVEGYSLQFRHVEFRGALSAVLLQEQQRLLEEEEEEKSVVVKFENALQYTGTAKGGMSTQLKLDCYNQAMQYVTIETSPDDNCNEIDYVSACIKATQRCSLIHALYRVVAETTNMTTTTGTTTENIYDELNRIALENGDFRDMEVGQIHGNHTWCVRVRHYGSKNRDDDTISDDDSNNGKECRYGHRARSLTLERQALQALKPLLLTFGGKVDLKNPDCKIYVFDGLVHDTTAVLARRMAVGPRISLLNPNTRLCVTNTPLCPIAAYSLCNVAQLRAAPQQSILDPFAGSCTILLAAAMMEPSTKTVGIEIAHNGIVNRDDVRKDFAIRNLVEPVALIHGDSSDARIREQARDAVGGQPFDCIITDPPYGIRESTGYVDAVRPIDEIFKMICHDRDAGTPLLKKGGRLVVFLPCQREEESFRDDVLPTTEQMRAAGLQFELAREQPLNDVLSRWLVSFICIE